MPPLIGTITQYPLPKSTGSVYGQNYFGFPFTSNGQSKQSDMCYCPLNNRIYAQGGDTIHSATDGTWSVDATAMNDWRLDRPPGSYVAIAGQNDQYTVNGVIHHYNLGTTLAPAPHSLQDDFGIAWVEAKKQFLLWPGQYFAYEVPGAPVLNWTGGIWWFDPVTLAYTNDQQLFPNLPFNGVLPGITAKGTQNPYGGVFDEVNNQILMFADSSFGNTGVNRWDVNAMVELPFEKFTIDLPPSNPKAKAVYYHGSKPIKIGRIVYFVGYSTDGSALKIMRMWAYDLDKHALTECASPLVDGSLYRELEAQLNTSNGMVVWLFTNCPQGGLVQPDGTVLPLQIWIYDPAQNVWAEDTQTKPDSFRFNVTCSLPDGRIAGAGGSYMQQTMFSFYQLQPT